MPDPADLLGVARLLSTVGPQSPPNQAQLRRAVSTAYYAWFHKVLRAAADRFVGPRQENSAAYAILYRSFDHAYMRKICEDLQVSTLKEKIRRQLRRRSVSQDTKDFAGIFLDLQDLRHIADYDPTTEFVLSDVVSLIDSAEVAMDAFDRIASDERADVLALLMVRARS